MTVTVRIVIAAIVVLAASGTTVLADEPYPTRPITLVVIQTPIAYQDADEFKAWWAKDARTLAGVIKRIGKIETK